MASVKLCGGVGPHPSCALTGWVTSSSPEYLPWGLISPRVSGGPELGNLQISLQPLTFYDAKPGAQGSGDKSVTETNSTTCDQNPPAFSYTADLTRPDTLLPVGMKDAAVPKQGCTVTPRWPGWTHWHIPTHIHTQAQAHIHTHT